MKYSNHCSKSLVHHLWDSQLWFQRIIQPMKRYHTTLILYPAVLWCLLMLKSPHSVMLHYHFKGNTLKGSQYANKWIKYHTGVRISKWSIWHLIMSLGIRLQRGQSYISKYIIHMHNLQNQNKFTRILANQYIIFNQIRLIISTCKISRSDSNHHWI